MGSSYCLSTDKKSFQNDQTVNIKVCEEYIDKNKITQISNNDYINKNIVTTEGPSNNGKNLKNNVNHSSIIKSNDLSTSLSNNQNKNNEVKNQKLKNIEKNSNNANKNILDKKNSKKGFVELSNDVIVSGNEINPEKIYQKTKMLGSGAFGEVWLVHHNDLDRDFAMKIIKKRKNKPNDEKEILNEIEILKKLDHPKILKIIDFYATSKKYYIITEYCPEGELFNEIIKVGKFDEGHTAFIINQILKAMVYCHKMNIIHRDLKPENIMITVREKNGCLQVKIIDFGTAKIFEKGQQ